MTRLKRRPVRCSWFVLQRTRTADIEDTVKHTTAHRLWCESTERAYGRRAMRVTVFAGVRGSISDLRPCDDVVKFRRGPDPESPVNMLDTNFWARSSRGPDSRLTVWAVWARHVGVTRGNLDPKLRDKLRAAVSDGIAGPTREVIGLLRTPREISSFPKKPNRPQIQRVLDSYNDVAQFRVDSLKR